LGFSRFEAAAKMLEPETGPEFIEKIAKSVTATYLHSMLMLACFSLDADVLGQWRAYADDGRGFAIGFSAKQMQNIPFKRQLRVLYDESALLSELTGNLKHIYEVEKSTGFKYGDQFKRHLYGMAIDLCAYKNPAFQEEKEIRLVHVCGVIAGKSKKIVPAGALSPDGKRLSKPLKTHFRMSKGVLVPYVIVEYSNKGAVAPIKEIVLGPQNRNSESDIEIFLNTIGLTDITVRRSNAPYRS
jgi:hypothetical protein